MTINDFLRDSGQNRTRGRGRTARRKLRKWHRGFDHGHVRQTRFLFPPFRANQFSRIRKTRSRRYRDAQPFCLHGFIKLGVKLRPRLEDETFVSFRWEKLVPRSPRFRRAKNGATNLESRNDYGGVDPVLQPDKSYIVQRRWGLDCATRRCTVTRNSMPAELVLSRSSAF